MSKSSILQSIKDALYTLKAVTTDLVNGIREEELIHRYQGQIVVPGVNIRQHLQELHAGGCLYHKEGKIFLKDSCNPFKLAHVA